MNFLRSRISRFLKPDAPRITLIAVLWSFFALTFKIHGFSIEQWGSHLGWEKRPFFQIGHSRGIRSDDWLVNFTYWKMQASVTPPSPAINPLLGYGQSTTVGSCPVFSKHWSSLFKLHTWGFLFGVDFGMSWLWVFYSVGLFLGLFWLLRILLPASLNPLQAALLAVAFLFSNFLQFWSYNTAPAIIYAVLLLLAWIGLFEATGKRLVLTYLAWIWSGVSFALFIYPPSQIVLAQALVLAGAASLVRYFRSSAPRPVWVRLALAGSGILLMLGILGIYFLENHEVIQAMRHTVYPGQRLSLGGDLPWIRLFQDILVPLRKVLSFGELGGNICEAACFLHFVPLLLVLGWAQWKRLTGPQRISLGLLSGYFALLMSWWLIGFTPAFARLTGFNFLPGTRSVLALGILNFALLIWWFSLAGAPQPKGPKRIWGIWILCLAFILLWLLRNRPELGFSQVVPRLALAISLFAGVAFSSWMLALGKKTGFCASFAILSLLPTFSFNPMVFGGTQSLVAASPLLQLIQRIQKTQGAGAWIVFENSVVAHAPSLAGVPSFTGVYFYPQAKLWEHLDPEHAFEKAWNRYSHLTFRPLPPGGRFRVTSPVPDTVIVETRLDDPRFLKELPFRYFLIDRASARLVPPALYQEIGSTGDWIAYQKRGFR